MATDNHILHALVDLVEACERHAKDWRIDLHPSYQNAVKVIREHTAPGGDRSSGPDGEYKLLPKEPTEARRCRKCGGCEARNLPASCDCAAPEWK